MAASKGVRRAGSRCDGAAGSPLRVLRLLGRLPSLRGLLCCACCAAWLGRHAEPAAMRVGESISRSNLILFYSYSKKPRCAAGCWNEQSSQGENMQMPSSFCQPCS